MMPGQLFSRWAKLQEATTQFSIVLSAVFSHSVLDRRVIVQSMSASVAGQKFACGTACHTHHETNFVASTVAQKVYSMARNKALKLPGFPDFGKAVKEISEMKEIAQPSYEVTVPLGNGVLAVKQNLIEYWEKCEGFEAESADLIKNHNDKYNPHGVKRGADQVGAGEGSEESEPVAKKPKVAAESVGTEKEGNIAEKLLDRALKILALELVRLSCR